MEAMMNDNAEEDCVSEEAQLAENEPLLERSKDKYMKAYNDFVKYKEENKAKNNSEEVVLAYFDQLSKKWAPSSLWAYYSMLKQTLKVQDNIDLKSYYKVTALIKTKSAGYKPAKAPILRKEDINKFISEAPDSEWLDVKVACIFGICGALRTDELTKIKISDITKHQNLFLVSVLQNKTNVYGTFTISGTFYKLVEKYAALRPRDMTDSRFFVNYRAGKCTKQFIGKNTFSKMPGRIATFLKLANAKEFTGHSFQRSSDLLHYKQTTGGLITSTIVSSAIGASQEYKENVGDDSDIKLERLKATPRNIPSSPETCLLCLSTSKDTINFYSEQGRELDIVNILTTHFWFQLEDQTLQNICCDCWRDTESFHKFYQSIQIAHRIMEADFDQIENNKNNLEDDNETYQPDELDENSVTDFVKIENVTCDGEIYQLVQDMPNENFTAQIVKIESNEDAEDVKETDQAQVSDVKDAEQMDQSFRESDVKDDREIDLVPVKDSITEDVEIESDVEVYEEIDQLGQVSDENYKTDVVEIESDEDVEDDKEISQPNEIENVETDVVEIESDEDIEDDKEISQPIEIESDEDIEDVQTNSSQFIEAYDRLPKDSQENHVLAYQKFMSWKISKKIDKDCFSEAVLFEYFSGLKTKLQSTGLWRQYSLLKTTIQKFHNIYVCYPSVIALLKDSSSFKHQNIERPNIFQAHEIERFFADAPDIEFLATKVIMIFLLHGVSSDPLTKIEVKDVCELEGSKFLIKCPKQNAISSFILENEYAEYIRKYKQLRPPNVPHDRFFVTYQKGKCTSQPTGRSKILSVPKSIAQFLKIKNAKMYSSLSIHKESIPKKIGGPNSEPIKRSTETIVTSTIASSGETFTISMCEDAEAIAFDLLPEFAQRRHLNRYQKFMAWKDDQNIDKDDSFSAAVLVKYFNSMTTTYKPSSLWVEYSKLKTVIQKMDNINIAYPEVQAFLRTNASGYQPQKLSVFQNDEIQRFLREADDHQFLAVKVIMIFGTFGVFGETLNKVTVNDVTEQGSVFIVNVSEAKTNIMRTFTVENEYATYVRKYKQLRPQKIDHNRFFIIYENGRCRPKTITRRKLQIAAKIIAKFLNLKDPESYSGHSFCRKRIRKRAIRPGVLDVEECSPSKRKAGDVNAEHNNFGTSTEALKSSVDITVASASTISNTLQIPPLIYHVESHQPYGSTSLRKVGDVNAEHINLETSTEALKSSVDIVVASSSTIPNTLQIPPLIYHVQSHQPYGSTSLRKVGDVNAEHINLVTSTESLKSSVDITVANASTIPNTLQIPPLIYHVESHQVQPYNISTTNIQANDVYVLPDNH